MTQRVIGIIFAHENEVLRDSTASYCLALEAFGFATEIIDLSRAGQSSLLAKRLDEGEIAFCFGIQGIGSQLERSGKNLWTQTRVPFLSIHFDNPCYNPFNHQLLSPFVANLYHFESFLEIQQRYLNGAGQITGLLPFELFQDLPEPLFPYEQRPIRLLFLKTGGEVGEYTDYFNALPDPVSRSVWRQLERTRCNPNLLLCDLVSELFLELGLEREAHERDFWSVAQAMDYYIRRKRAIDFVDWLKFQEGAVIVGDGWGMIDRTNAKAEFRPSLPAEETIWLYGEAQFVCNTNPYGRDVLHERIVAGLLSGCNVLTDTNAWLDAQFEYLPAVTRFSWDQSLDAQLLPIIENEERAREASRTGPPAARKTFLDNKSIPLMIDYVDRIRVLNSVVRS